MRSNPYINALGASVYISILGLIFQFISSAKQNTPDNILDPIAFLSVFVFSVAVMAFLFFYRPAVLLMENKRAEAFSFFLKTLGTFGVITIVVILAVAFL